MADGDLVNDHLVRVAQELMEKYQFNKDDAIGPFIRKVNTNPELRRAAVSKGCWEALQEVPRVMHAQAHTAAKAASSVGRKAHVGTDNVGGLSNNLDTIRHYIILGRIAIMKAKNADLEEFVDANQKSASTSLMKARFGTLVIDRFTGKYPNKRVEELASERQVFDLLVEAQAA